MHVAELPSRELDITTGRVVRIWWLYAWRTFVGAFVAAFVLGFVWGVIANILGAADDVAEIGGLLIGMVASIAWSIVGVYMLLTKQYREFRIVLIGR